VNRGVVFRGVFVRGTETKVLSIELRYLFDFFFFEALSGTCLPRSGDAFLKSFTFAFPDGEVFPCLAPEAAGFSLFRAYGCSGWFFGGGFSGLI